MMKQSKKNIVEIKSEEEFQYYENFLQYGNFKEARVIFVGTEEGLDEQDVIQNYEGRKRWFKEIPDHIHYLEGNDIKKGFYIDDGMVAGWKRENSYETVEEHIAHYKNDARNVLYWEAKVMTVINSGKFEFITEEVSRYSKHELLRKGKETAMFDYYPLPKQGNNRIMYKNLENRQQTSHRKELIKDLYDRYPMPISFVYAGVEKGKFRLQSFYEELGFKMEEKSTSQVHPKFEGVVKPLEEGKKFLIGKREDKNQYCIITPFLGVGQIKDEDLLVILTWMKAIMEENKF